MMDKRSKNYATTLFPVMMTFTIISFIITLYNQFIGHDGHPMLIISSACILSILICSRILICIGRADLNNYVPTPYFWVAAIGTSLVYTNSLPPILSNGRKDAF